MKKIFSVMLTLLILGIMVFPTDLSAFSFSATNFTGTFAYDMTGEVFGNLNPFYGNDNYNDYFNTALAGGFDFTYIPTYPGIADIQNNPMTDWKWTIGISNLTLPWENTTLPKMEITETASYNDIMTGVNRAQAIYDEFVPIEICYSFDYSFTSPTTGHANFYLGTNLDPQWLPECLPDYYYGEFQSDARLDISADPVPEPISLVLFSAGLAGVGVMRRRRNK